MDDRQKATALACLKGAESDAMNFPAVVGALIDAGFESYAIDFRETTATYFLPGGESLRLATHKVTTAVAPTWNSGLLQAAIREAQDQVPGYTYNGFCEKVAAAGCASYIVSFSGRRALYIGRTAETHVEHFPQD